MNKKNVSDEKKQQNVELLLKKKQRVNFLLSQWKKRRASCERKIVKYRMNKRKFSQELNSLNRS